MKKQLWVNFKIVVFSSLLELLGNDSHGKVYSEYIIPFLLIKESYLVSESNLGAECLLGNFLMSPGTWLSFPSEGECHSECPESSHEHFGRRGDATQLEKNSVL